MPTTCQRCQGFLVLERICGDDQWIPLVRCVNCGNRTDRTMLRNQESMKDRLLKRYLRQKKLRERQPVKHVVAHHDDRQFNVPSSTAHHRRRQISNGNAMQAGDSFSREGIANVARV